MNVMIIVLNCQKCDQCLKAHKSPGLLFQGVLSVSLSSLSLSFCCSDQVSWSLSHSLSDMVTYWAVWKQLKIKYSFLRLIWKILNWQIWGVTEARAQTLKTCVGHNVYSPCILTITQPTSPVAPADISTHSSRHSTFSATLLRPLASRCCCTLEYSLCCWHCCCCCCLQTVDLPKWEFLPPPLWSSSSNSVIL